MLMPCGAGRGIPNQGHGSRHRLAIGGVDVVHRVRSTGGGFVLAILPVGGGGFVLAIVPVAPVASFWRYPLAPATPARTRRRPARTGRIPGLRMSLRILGIESIVLRIARSHARRVAAQSLSLGVTVESPRAPLHARPTSSRMSMRLPPAARAGRSPGRPGPAAGPARPRHPRVASATSGAARSLPSILLTFVVIQVAAELEERVLVLRIEHVATPGTRRGHIAFIGRVERLPAQQADGLELFGRLPALARLEPGAELGPAVEQPAAAGAGGFQAP